MPSFIDTTQAILEFLEEGQIGLARFLMTTYQNEIKQTMSIDGFFLEGLLRERVQYEQTQHLYEHIEQPKKRGLFGRKKTTE